ncbi:MAG TPA: RsmB/NOP family class I SAM-dependent RNA methyltransferase, partial [Burkholderiaceae bacterium]|nr:RsmB/NOP family class I SAM-dependent RNA methyltransferase [Burkholderiaceae bacterium]
AGGPHVAAGRFEPIGAAELSWLDHTARIDAASLPPAVAFSLPDWLFERLVRAWGDEAARAIARSLLQPAPLDLRVNLLKADREQATAALHADGIDARPLALAPTALRVDGKPALERSSAFEAGLVEVQDAGSQVLALLAAPRRGQTVVDFCAGAGGKTLALAALMRSTGQIFACDVSAARLARLKPRLARAGASNVQPFAIDRETDPKLDRLAGRADLVLVDAPCSGTGTLRRNPDLKWRLQEHEIAELQARQLAILRAAARLVKPGGALV